MVAIKASVEVRVVGMGKAGDVLPCLRARGGELLGAESPSALESMLLLFGFAVMEMECEGLNVLGKHFTTEL